MALEIDEILNPTTSSSAIIDGNLEESTEPRRRYSIEELESMRFADAGEQKRRWKEVQRSLEPYVVREYDALRGADSQSAKPKPKKKTKKAAAAAAMGPSSVAEAPDVELNNGVQMEGKGLTVDAIPESVSSVWNLGKKREAKVNGASEIGTVDNRLTKSDGGCGGRCYSRGELEALRFVNIREQAEMWEQLYQQLGLVKEFDGLWISNDWKRQPQKRGDPSTLPAVVLDEAAATNQGALNAFGEANVEEPFDEYNHIDEEEDSSSDEYDSIQRPAFFVEGDPDFDSGPPLDGLEYLRRVRWEAAHIPKVKVVRVSSCKLTSEQTTYMPSIPEIPKCPPNLVPSKDWETALLADFSELRQTISALENSCSREARKPPGRQANFLQQLKQGPPTLTLVLGMDPVSRAAALRNSISALDTACTLSRDDCLWLFALCASVDTPLDGDTCAALRCLLRRCSGLLALKSEPDDEVAMLSVLVAVTGKYFGQSEGPC